MRAVRGLPGLIATTEWLLGTGLRTVLYWQLRGKSNFCKAEQGDVRSKDLTYKTLKKEMGDILMSNSTLKQLHISKNVSGYI